MQKEVISSGVGLKTPCTIPSFYGMEATWKLDFQVQRLMRRIPHGRQSQAVGLDVGLPSPRFDLEAEEEAERGNRFGRWTSKSTISDSPKSVSGYPVRPLRHSHGRQYFRRPGKTPSILRVYKFQNEC